jgi:hypothetical protein
MHQAELKEVNRQSEAYIEDMLHQYANDVNGLREERDSLISAFDQQRLQLQNGNSLLNGRVRRPSAVRARKNADCGAILDSLVSLRRENDEFSKAVQRLQDKRTLLKSRILVVCAVSVLSCTRLEETAHQSCHSSNKLFKNGTVSMSSARALSVNCRTS